MGKCKPCHRKRGWSGAAEGAGLEGRGHSRNRVNRSSVTSLEATASVPVTLSVPVTKAPATWAESERAGETRRTWRTGEEERIKGNTDCRAALHQPQLALGPCCSEGGPHGGHDIAHIPEGPTPGFGSHRNHQEQLNQPEAPPAAVSLGQPYAGPLGKKWQEQASPGSAVTRESSAAAAACSTCVHPSTARDFRPHYLLCLLFRVI